MATEKNFQAADPTPPAGARNVTWQVDSTSSGTDATTGQPYFNTSAYMPDMVGDSGSGGEDGLVPAPAAGDAAAGKFLKADGTWEVPSGGGGVVIGFIINSGSTGTAVGPYLTAPRAGSLTKCVIVVKTSDPTVGLAFRINQNGVNIFSSDPTVAAGTSAGTVSISTSLTSSPLPVAANDVFTIDITSGTIAWAFTTTLE